MTKRARNGSGTVYQRKDGRYEARIMVDGRIRAFYGRTYDEAEAKLQDARKARKTGAPIVMPGRQPLGQYLAEWHEARAFATHSTRSQYAWAIARITPSIGHVRLTSLKLRDVENMLNAWRGQLSARSLHVLRAVLSVALEDAVRREDVTRNVATHARVPGGVASRSRTIEVLSLDEQRALLEAVRGDRLEALYVVTLFAGLRIGEALALSWADLDVPRGVLTVAHNMVKAEKGWQRVARTKTGAGRAIRLAPYVLDVLHEHRVRQLAEQREADNAWHVDHSLIFTTTVGTPLDQRNLLRDFHGHLDRAKLARRGFHALRHTAATRRLASGDDHKMVQTLLGHSRASVTLNVYAHVVPGLQDESAIRDGELLFGKKL